jgi:hypothetical protein
MNRSLAFIGALLLTLVSVSTTCFATPEELIGFTLEPERSGSGEIRASFRNDERGDGRSEHWSSGFPASELTGLDLGEFRAAGSRPLRFAIVREAGRLDCSGSGGESFAQGNCRFTSDPAFTSLLASRGLARPTDDEAWGMMALNVRRDLIDAIAAAHYPTPKVGDLIAMSAVGVNGRYISELARAGYRPKSTDALIEFRALGITPEWIRGFVGIGYANIPTDDLVQLKALGITPDFVSGFDKVGYRHLPVDSLGQLKALGITPEFARWAAGQRSSVPSVDELVQMKIFGDRPPR